MLLDFNETGIGTTELSHRSEHATITINTAKADLVRYLDITYDDEILFMQKLRRTFPDKADYQEGVSK